MKMVGAQLLHAPACDAVNVGCRRTHVYSNKSIVGRSTENDARLQINSCIAVNLQGGALLHLCLDLLSLAC